MGGRGGIKGYTSCDEHRVMCRRVDSVFICIQSVEFQYCTPETNITLNVKETGSKFKKT